MELLILLIAFWVWSFCRSMSKAADRRGIEEAHRLYHMAAARRELDRLNGVAAEIRRDIGQFKGGPGDDIPPGAPDPLADFMARRKENGHSS
jgi:hypothetical protein